MSEFESEVITRLASLEVNTSAIKENLVRQNGSVASQGKAIRALELDNAKREHQCPLVDQLRKEWEPFRDQELRSEGSQTESSKFMDRYLPTILVLGAYLVLLHAKDILALLN